jgi:uncharacterized protein YndB with AHSA1/START domain
MTRTVVHDTFVIERTYAASPSRVFAAFADSAQKVQWFGDPDIEKLAGHTIDFRVGGRESMRGDIPGGGTTFTYDALYQDIVDAERIVFTYDMTMNDKRISVSVATFEFLAEPGGGTQLILTEQGAYLDGLDTSAAREEGSRAFFENLAKFLDEGAT